MQKATQGARSLPELHEMAHAMRCSIVQMLAVAGTGHLGGSLSCADILAVLYGRVMRIYPTTPALPKRDRFVLSIGHVAPAYYAALAESGLLHRSALLTLRQLDSPLQGHPSRLHCPEAIDSSSGSLGQGLSVGLGFALAARLDQEPWRAFVLLGDGELQEGQVWEAAMAAAHHGVSNLVAVVDWNGVQIDGPTRRVMSLGSLASKWIAFGWNVLEVDGHNIGELVEALECAASPRSRRPTVVLAKTVMGCGIREIEGDHLWHGKAPSSAMVEPFIASLTRAHKARMQGGALYHAEGMLEYLSKRGGVW